MTEQIMVDQPSPHNQPDQKANSGELGPPAARVPHLLRETVDAWSRLGLYERFEQAVSLVLTLLVGIVILVAMAHLVITVLHFFIFNLTDPVEHVAFQAIFGMILTVLIAMEFNHSILSILRRKHSIVQLQTVILIALLAMARKFIIIDASNIDPLILIGLAFAVLALGGVYWLVREQDHRETKDETYNSTPG
jgi:uncharacterized membrane protein (DUF373 family)